LTPEKALSHVQHYRVLVLGVPKSKQHFAAASDYDIDRII